MELLKALDCPANEFTPIPFWFLNGDLQEDEIERQLRDFCAHGVYGVVLHPRISLPERIGYLSATYFAYIRKAVECAARLEMQVVLYDEGMYPSGSANGQVVATNPEFASQGIALVSAPAAGDTLLAQTPQGVLVARKSGGTIRGIHFGEDDGESGAPASADILNPAVVSRFLSLTHEAYYRELSGYFGNTIIGFFTDEPSILGRNVSGMFPWTKGFADIFTAAGGHLAGLAALFAGQENEDTALYHRLILAREGEVYYGALSRWCVSHGIALMGHPHQSDDIEVEKYFQVPGQDLCLRWLAPEKDGLAGIDSTMGKCGADAARLMGRRRNSNECFGACNRDENPWQLSGGDVKWYLDWLAVRGVNLFIPHAFYYSIEGPRKGERPPDVGPNSIWWPHYERWAMYMRRLACLMTDARLHATVAVPCKNRDLLPDLVAPLFRQQIGFQYLPQSVWADCREENGTLRYQDQCYTAVLGAADKFSTVPHPMVENLPRDCRCDPARPNLRVAHFTRAGSECWFLVNEGETTLETRLTLPTSAPVGQYDLWNGVATRCTENGTTPLTLPRRGSLLLFACTAEEYAALPEQQQAETLPCPAFTLQTENLTEVRREYTATLVVSEEQRQKPQLLLRLRAEEMAELSVNGHLAGVGFWAPQVFDVTKFVQAGANTLHLVVTGSLANRYGDHPVPFGLESF